MARGNGTINRQGVVWPTPPALQKCDGPGPPRAGSKGSRPNNEWKKEADSPSNERFYGEGLDPSASDGRKIDVSGTGTVSGNVPETRQSGVQDPAEKA